MLFLPNEMFFAAALDQIPDLYDYAAARDVVLATPTTLIGLLRAVAYGWKQAALAESAAEVFRLGRDLHAQARPDGQPADKLGRALRSSVNAYNETIATVEGTRAGPGPAVPRPQGQRQASWPRCPSSTTRYARSRPRSWSTTRCRSSRWSAGAGRSGPCGRSRGGRAGPGDPDLLALVEADVVTSADEDAERRSVLRPGRSGSVVDRAGAGRSRRSSGGSAKTSDSSVSRSSRAAGKPRSTR